MKDQADDKQFSEEEIALRMNNAVRRALSTPPKPRKNSTTARSPKAKLTRAARPKSKN